MKPRIKIARVIEGVQGWWCEGRHPKHNSGITCAYGPTPLAAYERWVEYWDIPF